MKKYFYESLYVLGGKDWDELTQEDKIVIANSLGFACYKFKVAVDALRETLNIK